MFEWIKVNAWNIIIILVLAAVVCGITASRIKRKKSGKGGCSGCCEGCAMGCKEMKNEQ
ncbi:MAG: FeoB-associated Cys-rich membrane protein [Oscillospiraceae bacterium]|nr:FeoB-associated Cys-rich membrane protein [Oscillospiraceae bacterium]